MSKFLIKSVGVNHFRRAGIQATRDGVVVEGADLSDAQIAALEAEPRIQVELLDAADAGDAKPAAGDAPVKTKAKSKSKK